MDILVLLDILIPFFSHISMYLLASNMPSNIKMRIDHNLALSCSKIIWTSMCYLQYNDYWEMENSIFSRSVKLKPQRKKEIERSLGICWIEKPLWNESMNPKGNLFGSVSWTRKWTARETKSVRFPLRLYGGVPVSWCYRRCLLCRL